jgi:hypothetical protein
MGNYFSLMLALAQEGLTPRRKNFNRSLKKFKY